MGTRYSDFLLRQRLEGREFMDPRLEGEAAPIKPTKAKNPLLADELLLEIGEFDDLESEIDALVGEYVPSRRDWAMDTL